MRTSITVPPTIPTRQAWQDTFNAGLARSELKVTLTRGSMLIGNVAADQGDALGQMVTHARDRDPHRIGSESVWKMKDFSNALRSRCRVRFQLLDQIRAPLRTLGPSPIPRQIQLLFRIRHKSLQSYRFHFRVEPVLPLAHWFTLSMD